MNDNRVGKEENRPLGEGTIDFEGLFDRLETEIGYEGHYTLSWATLEGTLEGREYLADTAGDE